jgi:hypothetical protein
VKKLLPIVALLVGCTTPPPLPTVIERKQGATEYVSVISVREPVTESQVQRLVDEAPGVPAMVRVFTYTEGKTPGTDKPEHLWEWTPLDGLKTRY